MADAAATLRDLTLLFHMTLFWHARVQTTVLWLTLLFNFFHCPQNKYFSFSYGSNRPIAKKEQTKHIVFLITVFGLPKHMFFYFNCYKRFEVQGNFKSNYIVWFFYHGNVFFPNVFKCLPLSDMWTFYCFYVETVCWVASVDRQVNKFILRC